ncbi:Hypothetical protein PHPALM_2355, partial [Phytophthora palmivora]
MLPPEGYVRLNSAKYRDWQVLAYELAIDKDWLYKEQELYANWLSRHPLAVERKPYHWPKGVNERPHEAKKGKPLTCTERWAAPDTEKEVNDAQEAVAESNRSYSDDQEGLAELEGINSAIEPSSECRNQQGVMREERCTSPWDSPIVIVLKKNGVDIRLCIDYKMVNALTTIIEYAMPFVNDLLSELEKYLWFCSLDAASGFWAVMMTSRARRISAFVCALGHLEWLRMSFGSENAPMIYQRMIDNGFARRIRRAEEVAATPRQSQGGDPTLRPTELDPLQELIDCPESDIFTCGEPDQSVLTPVFTRRSFADDICFGGATFNECLETLDRLLTRLAEGRISISFSKSIFVQPKVDFLSHEVTSEGIRADSNKTLPIAELPFLKTKKGIQAFLGALNYYGRFTQNLAVYGTVLYQLKDSDFDGNTDLSAAQAAFAELKSRVSMAPILRHFDSAKEVHFMLFASDWALSSTLMQMHDDKLHT